MREEDPEFAVLELVLDVEVMDTSAPSRVLLCSSMASLALLSSAPMSCMRTLRFCLAASKETVGRIEFPARYNPSKRGRFKGVWHLDGSYADWTDIAAVSHAEGCSSAFEGCKKRPLRCPRPRDPVLSFDAPSHSS